PRHSLTLPPGAVRDQPRDSLLVGVGHDQHLVEFAPRAGTLVAPPVALHVPRALQLAGSRELEPLGGALVSLDLWHHVPLRSGDYSERHDDQQNPALAAPGPAGRGVARLRGRGAARPRGE